MGADAFIAFYGVRYILTDAELDAVEEKTDARVVAAKRTNLQAHFGRLTDGQPWFLLVGTRLGVFGSQNESQRSLNASQLEHVMRDTVAKLEMARLQGEPMLYLQYEAQQWHKFNQHLAVQTPPLVIN
ncbi:MAG: hypothetical protein QM811_29730 [Pirellulales bacterium]